MFVQTSVISTIISHLIIHTFHRLTICHTYIWLFFVDTSVWSIVFILSTYVTFIWSCFMETSVWSLVFAFISTCHIYMVILHGDVSVEPCVRIIHMSHLYGHSPWRRQCGALCSDTLSTCHIYLFSLHGDISVEPSIHVTTCSIERSWSGLVVFQYKYIMQILIESDVFWPNLGVFITIFSQNK